MSFRHKTLILDGRALRDKGVARLKGVIGRAGIRPTLAILQVGARPESTAYITQKKNFAEKIGAEVLHKKFPESVTAEKLIGEIKNLNADKTVHGIIVQLPLPSAFDKQTIIDTVAPEKDTDGLTSANKKLFEAGDLRAVVPATARGVLSLLRGYGISARGKKATVIGRSALVGAPIATLLLREGATVTVCHRGSVDIPAKSREADILVVAAGVPHFVTADFVKAGETVMDVGINLVEQARSHPLGHRNGHSPSGRGSGERVEAHVEKLEYEIPRHRLVGDVDFEAVKGIVGAISPVPGGVGPMTVLSLFENLLEAAGVVSPSPSTPSAGEGVSVLTDRGVGGEGDQRWNA